MCWSYHSALRLIRLAAGRIVPIPHGIWHMPIRLGYVVGVAWHIPVTRDAPTLRLPSAERRVSCGDKKLPLRQSFERLSPLRLPQHAKYPCCSGCVSAKLTDL